MREVAGGELIIDAPVEPSEVEPLPAGGHLWLSWTTERGLHHLEVQLSERLDDPPRWRVAAVGPPAREQRREGDRVPVMATVSVHAEGRSHEAQLIDLSVGGLRCLLAPNAGMSEGAACEVTLDVVRAGLRVPAEIVRVREGFDGKTDVAVRFEQTSTAVTDELRDFVFRVQLEHDRLDPG